MLLIQELQAENKDLKKELKLLKAKLEKHEKRTNLKTIAIEEVDYAVFKGSSELKELIKTTLGFDKHFFKAYGYNEYNFEKLEEIENLCKNNEFNLLINEMEEENFKVLRIY